ncbi:MAG: anti-ECFsigma factor, ChrR [Solirubrobacterales bacterium]|nr:anti-ECFsigma factor, ChrR [Solirubrobacterales bacterium]
MTETNHERCNEDVAAYMLGALEPDEAAALEHHAASCERCQAEIRWLTPALDALPEGVERLPPPSELRARLVAEVRADARGGAATGSAVRGDSRAATPGLLDRASAWMRDLGSGPMGLRPVAGVAVAVLVVAGVAGFAIGGGIGIHEGGSTSTVVAGKAPGVTAKMIGQGDSGTLYLANVKQLPSDRVLEAWVQRDGEVEPVEALFVPDRKGQASTELPDMNGVEVVMVTTEPSGGSETPTGEPLISIPVQ